MLLLMEADLAQGHAVFEAVAFVRLTLWNFASRTDTLCISDAGFRKPHHPERYIPGLCFKQSGPTEVSSLSL